jgi:hypothetical protein
MTILERLARRRRLARWNETGYLLAIAIIAAAIAHTI